MKTVNRSTVKGRIGKDPTFSPMPSGDLAVRFQVATDHVFQRREGAEKHTEWHQVKTFVPKSKEALFRSHLYSGAWVYIEAPSITEVFEKDEKKEFFRFLRPFPEDIDFLSPPKQRAEEIDTVDEAAYAPVSSRPEDDDAPPPPLKASNAPASPAPTPQPQSFAASGRGRLWDDVDTQRRPAPSRPSRHRGSVKDLLEQDD